jgi:hypothetical protein
MGQPELREEKYKAGGNWEQERPSSGSLERKAHFIAFHSQCKEGSSVKEVCVTPIGPSSLFFRL